MSASPDQLKQGLQAAQAGVQQAIDQIPPEAWPLIDIMMKITMGLAIVWLGLALIAWWRRRAYNLTIASTAHRSKQAQPDFLHVDKQGRKQAIGRGEGHEEVLEAREKDDAQAALKAAREPLSLAGKMARAATFMMSLFTLATSLTGAVFGVTRMGDYLAQAGTSGRISFLVQQYPLGCAVAVFAVGYNVWRYVADKKWEKA